MKCIIHVGVHKTGSSSIQMAMDGFDDGTVVYADLGEANHSLPLQTIFLEDHLEGHWHRMGKDAAKLSEMYSEKLRVAINKDRDVVVLSGENVSLFDVPALARMRSYLEQEGGGIDSFEIVMFVRDPMSWAASIAQEGAKHGAGKIDDLRAPSFEERYRALESVFEEKNIRIVCYEDSIERFGNVVNCFRDILNVNLPEDRLSIYDNKSMSESALKVVLRFNNLGIDVRQSEVMDRAHWRFVGTVTKLFQSDKAISRYAFRDICNVSDYKFCRERFSLRWPEAMVDGEDLRCDFNFSDMPEIGVIRDFLSTKGIEFGGEFDADTAIKALYYFCVGEEIFRDVTCSPEKSAV